MSYADSILSDLNDSLVASQAERRVAAVRQLADQFLDQAPHLTEAAVDLYDVALQWLVRDLELRARIELSEQLADIANAPRGTVHLLGQDEEIRVAAPVLERSPRFDERTLTSVALDRGEGHLMAIARRAGLGPAVTDILVRRGSHRVLHRIAANETARFSPSSAEELVERTTDDRVLARILCQRFSLMPAQGDEIVGAAKSLVRELLISAHRPDIESSVINAALDRSIAAMNAAGGLDEDEGDQADATAAQPRPDPAGRDEGAYLTLLASQQVPAALVLLAQLSGLSVDAIGRIYRGHRTEMLLTVLKAADMTWEAARATLALKMSDDIEGTSLENLRRRYVRLSTAEAKYALRFECAPSDRRH